MRFGEVRLRSNSQSLAKVKMNLLPMVGGLTHRCIVVRIRPIGRCCSHTELSKAREVDNSVNTMEHRKWHGPLVRVVAVAGICPNRPRALLPAAHQLQSVAVR